MKRALITGITGQDGSHLADFLLTKGYEVYGMCRHVATEHGAHRFGRVAHLMDKSNLLSERFRLVSGNLDCADSLRDVMLQTYPDEIYHLGAMSFVSYSFDDEASTLETNFYGTHRLLALTHRIQESNDSVKFYHAGSSEQFGLVEEIPQTEKTRFHPRSVYGVSKVAGYEMTRHYRERYKLFACNGILFNHEGVRRQSVFVTRKITLHAAAIKHGLIKDLYLGDIQTKRDWGCAKDYVEAMWMMMQHPVADDWVVATGEEHTIEEFLELSFSQLGLNWRDYVRFSPSLVRPSEVPQLLGDSSKIRRELGWSPKYTFKGLVEEMTESDLRLIRDNPSLAATLGKPGQ